MELGKGKISSLDGEKNRKRISKILRLGTFNHTLSDAKLLLALYRNRKAIAYPFKGVFDSSERCLKDEEADALLRGGIILCVTAIEVYVERAITDKFNEMLFSALKSEEVGYAFDVAYESWLERHKRHKKSEYDAAWSEENWKNTVYNRFLLDLKSFHNPNPKNINVLCRRYTGIRNIVEKCSWDGVSGDVVVRKLEKIVSRRGEVVHHGKKLFGEERDISENELAETIEFSERLIGCLEAGLFISRKKLRFKV